MSLSLRDRLRSLDDDVAWEVLALLGAAVGPMTVGDLATILGHPGRRVRAAVEPLRDDLGADHLVLTDLDRQAVLAELSAAEQEAARGRLVRWCVGWATAGWPDETPVYAVEHGTRHILASDDLDAIAALLDQRLIARRGHPGDLGGIAAAARRAGDLARASGPAGLPVHLQAALIRATAVELADQVPPQVLAVLLPAGSHDDLCGYPALMSDPEARGRGWLKVAAARRAAGRLAEADAGIDEALAAARVVTYEWRAAKALLEVVRALVAVGRLADARSVAREARTAAGDDRLAVKSALRAMAIAGEVDAAFAAVPTKDRLSSWQIPDALAEIGRVAQAVAAVPLCEPGRDGTSRQLLSKIADTLAMNGQPESARALVDGIAAHRNMALRSVAVRLATAGHDAAALGAARSIEQDDDRAVALGWVARALARYGHPGAEAAADEAIAAVYTDASSWSRVRTLTTLAAAWQRTALRDASVRVVDETAGLLDKASPEVRCSALCAAVPVLLQAGRTEAAATAAKSARAAALEIESDDPEALPARAEAAQALARAGLPGDAAVAAGAVIGELAALLNYQEEDVLGRVSAALALSGDLASAVAVGRRASFDWYVADVLAVAARELGWAGRSTDAIAVVQAAGDREVPVAAAAVVGFMEAGLASEAVRLLESCSPFACRRALAAALDELTLADAGALARLALGLVTVPIVAHGPAVLLTAAAGALRPDGATLAEEAVNGLTIIKDPDHLCSVGSELVQAGHPVMARTLARSALASAVAVAQPEEEDAVWGWRHAIERAAGLLTEAGDPDDAVTAIATVVDPQCLVRSLGVIGRLIASPQHRAASDRVWPLVEPLLPPLVGTTPADLAGVLASFGQVDAVLDLVESLDDPTAQSAALADAALRLALRADSIEALHLVDLATARPNVSATALATAARAVAHVGGREARARELVDKVLAMEGAADLDNARQIAARALFDAGDPDRGLVELGACKSQWLFGVEEVLEQLTDRGDRVRADALVELLPRSSRKYYLDTPAKAAARDGERVRAHALAVEMVDLAAEGGRDGIFTVAADLLRLLPLLGLVDQVEPAVRALVRLEDRWAGRTPSAAPQHAVTPDAISAPGDSLPADGVALSLRDIVTKQGPDAIVDARRLEALLRDLSGEHRREIHLIMVAHGADVPDRLRAVTDPASVPLLIAGLVRMLVDDRGLTEPAARWAVHVWAAALVPDLAQISAHLRSRRSV